MQENQYSLFFNNPIKHKQSLMTILSFWGCADIQVGPTEESIKFRLVLDDWGTEQWDSWALLLCWLKTVYDYSDNSDLPRRNIS